MKNKKTAVITRVAILAAMSIVLMRLETPPLFGTTFLKLDVADVPAALAGIVFGPLYGIAVVLIKNMINVAASTSGGIGEIANFIYGSILVLSLSLSSKIKILKNANANMGIMGMLGTLIMTAAAYFINEYLIFPMYSVFMPIKALLAFLPAVIYFNLLKGALISALTLAIQKRVKVALTKGL